jgi:predicted acylesterase/phospholipase RssA
MEDIPLYLGKRKNILVLSGGGIKGLAMLGSIKYLVENEIIVKPDIFCGSSVGCVISLFLNIGYSVQDIYNFLESLDFNELFKYNIDNIFNDAYLGFFTIDPLMHIVITFLKKKNISKDITFKELYELTKSKLIITGTCINDTSLHYFSIDHTPDMKVLNAIRITISIPIIFKPYKYNNKLWVDGACINNYPIELFKDKLNDTIGILLDSNSNYIDNFDEIDKYFFRIITCLIASSDGNKFEIFNKNTIKISVDYNFMDFNISTEIKKKMFTVGYETTKNFYEFKI